MENYGKKVNCHEDKDCNEQAVKQSKNTSRSEGLETDYSIKSKKNTPHKG